MHRLLTPQAHGLLDLPLAAAFVLAPFVAGFWGLPRWLSIAVGLLHLAVTLLGRPPRPRPGLVKPREPLDFTVHGVLEALMAPALAAAPWLLGFSGQVNARNFFLGAAAVMGVLWALTHYRAAPTRHDRSVWRTRGHA